VRSKRPFTTSAILLISLLAPAAARGGEPLCDWLGGLGEAAERAAAGDLEGRLAAARQALASRQSGPASALAHLAAASALLAAGRGLEVLPHLEPARALAAPRLRDWLELALGEALLGAGRAAEAAAALGRAAALGDGPAARRAAWLEGRALLEAGRPRPAAARLEACLRRSPQADEARRGRLDLGQAELRLGRADAALRRWRELALEAPEQPEGQAALDALVRHAGEPGAPPAARLTGLERLLRAERLLARGRAGQAWTEADAAAAAQPPAPGPRLQLLRALIRGLHYALDHPNEAVALIQKDWNLDRDTAQNAYDVAMPTYNMRGDASDDLVAASIKRSVQDAKISESKFAPKDFVDWTIMRSVMRDLKR